MGRGILSLCCYLLIGTACTAAQGIPLGSFADTLAVRNCSSLNTTDDDTAPVRSGGALYYLSGQGGDADAYRAEPRVDATFQPGERFANLSPRPTGALCFSADGQTLYYSAATGGAGDAPTIYRATLTPAGWSEGVPLWPGGEAGFANRQPSVTPDGTRLFFASNRPGGYGGFDLYFSDRVDGRWGPPINLGHPINTVGNETFPRYHAGGMLYFASDGHPGMGGCDLFSIDIGGRRWGEVRRLPAPINSPSDEVSFTIEVGGRNALLASNRPGGRGGFDIYTVEMTGIPTAPALLHHPITVVDAGTLQRLARARVWVRAKRDAPGAEDGFALDPAVPDRIIRVPRAADSRSRADALITDGNGQIVFPFRKGEEYDLHVEREGYGSADIIYRNGAVAGGADRLTVALNPSDAGRAEPRPPESGFLGATLSLPEIRYPVLSANPDVRRSPDLAVLLRFLREYPSLNVLLVAHAAGPHDEEVLARLSEERAVRLRRYLAGEGIEAERIRTIGYGDRFPLRPCDPCTEEDYRINSRLEAKVVAW